MTTLDDLNGYLDDEAYTVRVGELRALLSAGITDATGVRRTTFCMEDCTCAREFGEPVCTIAAPSASIADTAGAKPDCGECACLPGFCDKEGEVRSVLRMIVEKINAEGPASRDWQGFTHLCELAEQLLATTPSQAENRGEEAPSVDDASARTLVHQIAALEPLKHTDNMENAVRILSRAIASAPSVADAAGASERIKALFIENPSDEMGPSDEPESQYRLGYNTALEDAIDAIGKEKL
ncbi:hypothetical protein BSFA1_10460 [Burkholderia sp. SFA1]|nr:hypothetical protein BSFA1_10460 [Burkholderia sp. SFA1]